MSAVPSGDSGQLIPLDARFLALDKTGQICRELENPAYPHILFVNFMNGEDHECVIYAPITDVLFYMEVTGSSLEDTKVFEVDASHKIYQPAMRVIEFLKPLLVDRFLIEFKGSKRIDLNSMLPACHN